ncbi:hypothetical protein BBR62_RS11970, partial [Escherichia coli]
TTGISIAGGFSSPQHFTDDIITSHNGRDGKIGGHYDGIGKAMFFDLAVIYNQLMTKAIPIRRITSFIRYSRIYCCYSCDL